MPSTKYRAPRKPVPLAPNYSGERVRATYRVPPFLADESLTVALVENVGTRRKPCWRALCMSDRMAEPENGNAGYIEGWLDCDTLVPISG